MTYPIVCRYCELNNESVVLPKLYLLGICNDCLRKGKNWGVKL